MNKDEEYNEENEGPVQGDYIISTTGQLGDIYQVSIVEPTPNERAKWNRFNIRSRYKSLGWEDIIKVIKRDMILENFYPGVWYKDDHGGLTVVHMGG